MDFGKAVLPKKPLGRRLLRPRLDQQINNAFEVSTGQPGTTFNILPGGQSYVVFGSILVRKILTRLI